jgi:hypothetical protein
MEKTYKYIHIKEYEKIPNRKTKVYAVINNASNYVIGYIEWYPAWRQYCFCPKGDTVYSVGCMNDIIDFIGIATKELRNNV